MLEVQSETVLEKVLADQTAVLVLFGGQSCGVCQVIKPQLESLIHQSFPEMVPVYVDCQRSAPGVCASRGVFSLPVVQVWFEGRRFAEFVRVFSMGEVREAIERPYRALLGR